MIKLPSQQRFLVRLGHNDLANLGADYALARRHQFITKDDFKRNRTWTGKLPLSLGDNAARRSAVSDLASTVSFELAPWVSC